MVLAFSSIRLVGSQNYTAAIAFLPLIGMVIEHSFYFLGWLDVTRFELEFLYLGIGTAIGTFAVLFARATASKELSSQIAAK